MLLAISGYIGSGKSTVASILARRGFAVMDADRVAKEVMVGDANIRDGLVRAFGNDVIDGDGIDFAVLGGRAFASVGTLQQLNAIVHPPLYEHLKSVLDRRDTGDTVLDAALLPLSPNTQWFDRLWWVDADEKTRLTRIMSRTGLGKPTARHRMALQQDLMPPPPSPPWEVVRNEGEVAELQDVVERLLREG